MNENLKILFNRQLVSKWAKRKMLKNAMAAIVAVGVGIATATGTYAAASTGTNIDLGYSAYAYCYTNENNTYVRISDAKNAIAGVSHYEYEIATTKDGVTDYSIVAGTSTYAEPELTTGQKLFRTYVVQDGVMLSVQQGARFDGVTDNTQVVVLKNPATTSLDTLSLVSNVLYKDDAASTHNGEAYSGKTGTYTNGNGTIKSAVDANMVGATNAGSSVYSQWDYNIKDTDGNIINAGFYIDSDGTITSAKGLAKTYAQIATKDSSGKYVDAAGNQIPSSNVYVLNGTSNGGVNGDQGLKYVYFTLDGNNYYDGTVYGSNNEILLSGSNTITGEISSVWGTELVDPELPANLTVKQVNDITGTMLANDTVLFKSDVGSVAVTKSESSGNTTTSTYTVYDKGDYDNGGTKNPIASFDVIDKDTTYNISQKSETAANGVKTTTYALKDQSGTEISNFLDTDTTYAAGSGITINTDNVISVDTGAVKSAVDTKVTGLSLTDNVLTVTQNQGENSLTVDLSSINTDTSIQAGSYAVDEKNTVTLKQVDKNNNVIEGKDVVITGLASTSDIQKLTNNGISSIQASEGTGSTVNTYTLVRNDGSTVTGSIIDTNTKNIAADLTLDGNKLSSSVTDNDGNTITSAAVDLSSITTKQGDTNAQNININTDNINKNAKNIEINAQNINTNTDNINKNAKNIEINTQNINTNTDNINKNAKNIEINTQNINTNATNINNNAKNIETNTQNISTNTTNINENTKKIENNAQNISTNTSNIANNTKNIQTNTENITKVSNYTSENISNLYKNDQIIQNELDNMSTNFNKEFSRMNDKTERVGAGAAALAGIHYQSMRPGESQIGAGYGNYRDKSALAIGMAYQLNNRLSAQVSGSVCSDEYMMNVGLTYKFGQHDIRKDVVKKQDPQSMTIDQAEAIAMIKALKSTNAVQTQEIAELNKRITKLEALVTNVVNKK